MDKVFVVMGTTGEYSDRNEWPVVAYTREEDAQSHVAAATARANVIEATRENQYNVEKGINEFDPDMQMDYTGTDYYYFPIEVLEARRG